MYFYLEVICAKQDLHSGVFGGSVHEATVELSHIFSSLVDVKGTLYRDMFSFITVFEGKILIDGVGKEVDDLTEEEMKTYADIDFDMSAYQADVGTNKLTEESKVKLRRK